jgi:hypothetical protein
MLNRLPSLPTARRATSGSVRITAPFHPSCSRSRVARTTAASRCRRDGASSRPPLRRSPIVDPYPTGIESDGRKNTETLDPPNDPLCGSGGCDITKYPAPDPKTPPAKPPFPFTAWDVPQGGCVPGVGWDFEDGTFQGWKAEPLPPNDAFRNAFDQHDKRKKTHVGLKAPPGKDAPQSRHLR